MPAARLSLRAGGRSTGRRAGKSVRGRVPWVSGGERSADGDLGSGGAGGQARAGGREAQAGLGLRSRCRLRSTWTRRRDKAARMSSRFV
jgi:hypothetical protein